jgi:hypothetical protein
MPQTVCIHHAFPRREIHQLHAHSHNNPRDTQTRPHRPRASDLSVLNVAETTPEYICENADHDVGRHIVRVVPGPKRKVPHMQRIQQYAQRGPNPQQRSLPWLIPVQPKHANGRIIQPIQHIRARTKIVQLLCDAKVPGVENHAKRPARQTDVAEPQIVFAQRVARRYLVAQLVHAPVVGEVVEQREYDAEGLLHAHESVEGPFAVKLVDGLRGWARGGYDVLARVIAFGRTVPEEETAV